MLSWVGGVFDDLAASFAPDDNGFEYSSEYLARPLPPLASSRASRNAHVVERKLRARLDCALAQVTMSEAEARDAREEASVAAGKAELAAKELDLLRSSLRIHRMDAQRKRSSHLSSISSISSSISSSSSSRPSHPPPPPPPLPQPTSSSSTPLSLTKGKSLQSITRIAHRILRKASKSTGMAHPLGEVQEGESFEQTVYGLRRALLAIETQMAALASENEGGESGDGKGKDEVMEEEGGEEEGEMGEQEEEGKEMEMEPKSGGMVDTLLAAMGLGSTAAAGGNTSTSSSNSSSSSFSASSLMMRSSSLEPEEVDWDGLELPPSLPMPLLPSRSETPPLDLTTTTREEVLSGDSTPVPARRKMVFPGGRRQASESGYRSPLSAISSLTEAPLPLSLTRSLGPDNSVRASGLRVQDLTRECEPSSSSSSSSSQGEEGSKVSSLSALDLSIIPQASDLEDKENTTLHNGLAFASDL